MTTEIKTTAEAVEAAALPDAQAIHVNGDTPLTAEQKPLPPGMEDTPFEEKSPAQWAYERLVLYIQNFEEQLDSDHEIGMGFAGGDAGILRIEGMGFFDPDIVTFYGTDEAGVRTQLVQHVTQLNVMLRAMPKMSDTAEPTRIGFRLAADIKAG